MKVRLSSLEVGEVFSVDGVEYAVVEHLIEKKQTLAKKLNVDFYFPVWFFLYQKVSVSDPISQLSLF